jgi:penicillin-binding protein 1A
MEHGLTPATVRVDEPITIKDWSPDNYTETHAGPVTLEQAFARSINTVAVELGQEVGLPNVISVAHRLGIESRLEPNASLALGTSEVTPLELTQAYAAFATVGHRVQPYTVLEVRKANGDLVFRRNLDMQPRVISDDEALAMNSMMYQVVQWGTGRAAAVPGHEVAGKTGTSAEFRDAWFVGFSPELITGVWIGNDDFSPMKKITGGTLPAQIWSGFMRTALKNMPASTLPRAEPVSENPEGAYSDDGENMIQRGLDGIGSFFGNLFGGDSSPARRDRRSENDDRYAAVDDMTQDAMPPPAPPQTAAGNEETYVFRNGETGQTFVYKKTPNAPPASDGPPSP